MTSNAFQRLALRIAGAKPGEHMGHRDFRIGGRIFATVGYPDDEHAMVKLTPAQQKDFIAQESTMFSPCNGAWGRQGSTSVHLKVAKMPVVRKAIKLAVQNLGVKIRSLTSGRNKRER